MNQFRGHVWDWLPAILALPFTFGIYFALKGFFRWGKRLAHLRRQNFSKRLSLLAFSILAIGLFLRLAPLPHSTTRWGTRLILAGELFQVGLWAEFLFTDLLQRFFLRRAHRDRGPAPALAASEMPLGPLFPVIVKICVWTFVVLLIFDNLGIHVTSLITGLGIGGIAVALAAQNVLGDFFASLSIALDRPFQIGEFIQFNSFMGTVTQIGVKTTRLTSLSGEEIVYANSELLKQPLRNYTRMKERRVVGSFGLSFDCTPEQIAQVPAFIKAAVEAHPDLRLERAHFSGFGESALNFEFIYWVNSPDYNLYMDLQQQVSLQLMNDLRQSKMNFAHPYRTIRVETLPSVDIVQDSARAPLADHRGS